MRIIQSVFFLPVFFVFSLFSQITCYAGADSPWTMFLPAITSGHNTCGNNELIADRYLVNNCDVVKDTVTGLEWQRCSVGQTWNAETKHCDGSVIGYNWFGAQGLTKAGGFRLPTITELRSLVYCSSGIPITIGMTLDGVGCSEPSGPTFTRPTIVTAAFPDVPLTSTVRSHYWTSSTSADDPNRGRGVSFYRGNASSGPKDTPGLSARLVRTGN